MTRRGFWLALGLAIGAAAALPAAEPAPLRVLFVGNSLTYFSDIPGLVAEFGATAQPPVKIEVQRVMASATSLAKHLNLGKAIPAIERGGWTHVVLQPFGALAGETRALPTYRSAVAKCGARMVLYATPHLVLEGPDFVNDTQLTADRAALATMAADHDAWLAPAMDVCVRAKTIDPQLTLRHPARGKQNVHHGPEGAYLIAATLYTVLTGRSPVGANLARIPADKFTPIPTDLDAKLARWMQTLAVTTVCDCHARRSLGAGWTPPELPRDLPDLTRPAELKLSAADRQAAALAYRWKIYDSMTSPPQRSDAVRGEFNAGILQAIVDDFPHTPDAAKANDLWVKYAAKKRPTDSDNR